MPGIGGRQFNPQALTNLRTIVFELPLALDLAYAVASVDPNGVAAGAALTLTTQCAAGLPLQYPRLPTISITDQAFTSALSVTVRIKGRRFGKTVTQDITATSTNTTEVTVAGSKVIDEFISAVLLSKTNAAASDALKVGIDGKWLGLPHRVKNVRSVKQLFKIAAGTPNANGSVVMTTLQASAVVDVANSAINVFAAMGSTLIAVTDRYLVKYVPDGNDDFSPYGHLS